MNRTSLKLVVAVGAVLALTILFWRWSLNVKNAKPSEPKGREPASSLKEVPTAETGGSNKLEEFANSEQGKQDLQEFWEREGADILPGTYVGGAHPETDKDEVELKADGTCLLLENSGPIKGGVRCKYQVGKYDSLVFGFIIDSQTPLGGRSPLRAGLFPGRASNDAELKDLLRSLRRDDFSQLRRKLKGNSALIEIAAPGGNRMYKRQR